jgi:hypothetical protein
MAFDPSSIIRKSKENAQKKASRVINNKPKTQLTQVKKEDILAIVRNKGPVTPTEIKRDLKVESYLISAVLSELVNSHILNTTKVKKGTSIFYYLPEQIGKLENLISFLNEKDQVTVKLLRNKKVMQDKPQELFTRVSLRKIPDYAKPINIRISEDEVKLFWKYFLVSDDEAKAVIRKILTPMFKKPEEKPKQEVKPQLKQEVKPKVEKKIQPIKEKIKPILKKAISIKKQLKIENPQEAQTTFIDNTSKIEEKLYKDDKFLDLRAKLKQKNIIIKEATSIRKGKEYDLVIIIKTSIGESRFFAKYKNKKRCNDADISTALVVGQSKNLPVAFITSGGLTKKTKEQAKTLFKNVMIVEEF